MKKRQAIILLLLLTACTQTLEYTNQTPPLPATPAIPETQHALPKPPIIQIPLNPAQYTIQTPITPYKLTSTNAERDNFGIIPVERYDAHYTYIGINTTTHVFKFTTRQELDLVLQSEFFEMIQRGAKNHLGNIILLYLSEEDHRIAMWTSGTHLVYIDTAIPDFAALEVVNAYLQKYPSDLQTPKCIDTDTTNHYHKGTTTRIQIGTSIVTFEDTCLADFAPYRNKQYTPTKGIRPPDGLLEGACKLDPYIPGYIDEHPCPRGCKDGKCQI